MARLSTLLVMTLLLAATLPAPLRADQVDFESAPKATLYSESTYRGDMQAFFVQNQLKLHMLRIKPEVASMYVGLNWESDAASANLNTLSKGVVSPLLGARGKPFSEVPLWFFAEYRRAFLMARDGVDPTWESDWRPGAFIYDEWDLGPVTKHSRLFSETYGEAVFSSRLGSNFFTTLWSRLGLRAPITRSVDADAFANITLKNSSDSYAADNLAQMGPIARVRYRIGNAGAAISAGPAFTFNKNWTWTGLLVLNAEI